MSKPRKKDFKRDNKLKFAYKDMGFYSSDPRNGKYAGKPMGDFIGIVPLDEKGNWDINLLFGLFLAQPIHPSEYQRNEKTGKLEIVNYPPLIEELEKRGYDPKTIYFEIEKQGPNYTHDGVISYALGYGTRKPTLFEEFEKRSKALEIIKNKRVDVSFLLGGFTETLEEYNNSDMIYKALTIEEYRLLKEVLL